MIEKFRRWKIQWIISEQRSETYFSHWVDILAKGLSYQNFMKESKVIWTSPDQGAKVKAQLDELNRKSDATWEEEREMDLDLLVEKNMGFNYLFKPKYNDLKAEIISKNGQIKVYEDLPRSKLQMKDFMELRKLLIQTEQFKIWKSKYQNKPQIPQIGFSHNVINPQQQNPMEQEQKDPPKNRVIQIQKQRKQNQDNDGSQKLDDYHSERIVQKYLNKLLLNDQQNINIPLQDIQSLLQRQGILNEIDVKIWLKGLKEQKCYILPKNQISFLVNFLTKIRTSFLDAICNKTDISLQKKNQNAVLVVGFTGVGKSTFIQYLLGYKLDHKQIQKKSYNIYCLVPSTNLKPEHQSLYASKSIHSVTKNINGYYESTYKTSIYDSAGFSQTRGAQIQIANAVGLKKFLATFEGIRFVYLIQLSDLQVKKGRGVIKYAQQIVNMFKFESLDELKKLVIIILNNQFQVQYNDISEIINNCSQFLAGHNQGAVISDSQKIAIQYIKLSVKDSVCTFRYTKDNKPILDKIFKIKSFSSANNVKSIQLDTKTVQKIKSCGIISKKRVDYYLEKKDFQAVRYYHDRLKILHKWVPQHSSHSITQAEGKIQQSSIDLYNSFHNIINNVVLKFEATPRDFDEIRSIREQLSKFKNFKELSSGNHIRSDSDLIEKIKNARDDLLANIKPEVDEKLVGMIVQTIVSYSETFKDIIPNFMETCKQKGRRLLTQFQINTDRAFNAGSNRQLDDSCSNYHKIWTFYEQLKFNQNSEFQSVQVKLTALREIVKKSISQITSYLQILSSRCKEHVKIEQELLRNIAISSDYLQSRKLSAKLNLQRQIQDTYLALKQMTRWLSDQMRKSILNFYDFPLYFVSQIENLKVDKYNLDLLSSISISQIAEFITDTNTSVTKQIKTNILQDFLKRFEELIDKTEREDQIANAKDYFNINERVEMLIFYFPSQRDQLTKLLQKFKTGFASFTNKLKVWVDSVALEEANNEQTRSKYAKLNNYCNYQDFCSEFKQQILKIKEAFSLKIKVYCDKLLQEIRIKQDPNSVINLKNLNDSFLKRLNKYINSIYESDKNSRVKEQTKVFHKSVFEEVILLFGKITEFIAQFRAQKTDLSSVVKKSDMAEQKIEKQINTQSIKSLYNFLKLVTKDQYKAVQDYLQSGDKEFDLSKIEVTENIKQIESICDKVYQNIEAAAKSWALKPKDMKIPEILMESCNSFNLLARSIRDQADDYNSNSYLDFIQLRDGIYQKMLEANNKKLSNIQKCFHKEQGNIRSLSQTINLYNHLMDHKNHSQLGNQIQQTLQDFIQSLRQTLENRIANSNSLLTFTQNILERGPILRLSEDIKFYVNLENLLREEHLNIIQQLKQHIGKFINIIKVELQTEKKNIQELIQRIDYTGAEKRLISINLIYQIICFNIKLGDQNEEYVKAKSVIQALRDKKAERQKQIESIVLNPVSKQNRFHISTIFPKLSNRNRFLMQANILSYFENELYQYSRSDQGTSMQKYYQILEMIGMFPQELNEKYKLSDRINAQFNNKVQSQKNKLQANQLSIGQLCKKMQNFERNKNGSLIRQCEIKIKGKLNTIVKTVLEESSPVDIIDKAREIFWVQTLQQSPQSTKTVINEAQKTIFKAIKTKINKKFQKIEKIYEECSDDGEMGVAETLNTIFDVSRKLKNDIIRVSQKQQSKQLSEHIQYFKNKFYDKFKRLFNDDSLKKIQSGEGKIEQIKKFLKKIISRSLIIQKMIEASSEKSSMEEQGKDKEDKQIIQILQSFKKSLQSINSDLLTYFNSLDFTDKKYFNAGNYKLEEELTQLDNKLAYLKVLNWIQRQYSEVKYFDADYVDVERRLRKKYYSLIGKVKQQFKKAIESTEAQFPQQLCLLEQIQECINRGHSKFLREIPQNQMIDQSTHPRKQIYQDIEEIINQFGVSLYQRGQNLRNYYQTTLIQTQQKKERIKEDFNERTEIIRNKKQQKLQEVLASNKGKTESQKRELIKEVQRSIEAQKIDVQNTYEDNIKQVEAKIKADTQQVLIEFCSLLIIAKKIGLNIKKIGLSEKCESFIKNQLNSIEGLPNVGMKIIQDVSQMLDKCGIDNYAYIIKTENKHFRSEKIKEFNNKTKSQDLKYIIQNLTNKSSQHINPHTIKTQYSIYEIMYQDLVKGYISNPKQETIKNIVNQTNHTKQPMQQIAIILAIWTILNSNQKALSDDYLMKPHPVQIVAIILLIQAGQSDLEMSSKLAEILTGEGKSIVLATLACYLAKKGKEVSVACYSSYLSQRDFKNFEQLFDLFHVKDKIFYGTFNQICQRVLDDSGQKFKDTIVDYFTKKNFFRDKFDKFLNGFKDIFSSKSSQNKKVLLIDEVDVFFEKDFFGKLYRPTISLQGEQVKKLLNLIWQKCKKQQVPKISEVKNSEQFKKLTEKYPTLREVLQNQLNGMVMAAKNYAHDYKVHERQIKYQDNDGLSTTLSFGYKTIFAYYYQREQGRVNEESFERSQKIPLTVAQFSYSVLPSYFSFILGLSGTLSTLSDAKINILSQKYKIKKNKIFLLPSIYGDNEKRDVLYYFEKQRDIYARIIDRMQEMISNDRPVVICFQNLQQLIKFRSSPQFSSKEISTTELHELLDHEIRDKNIKTAGGRRRVMLMTAMFARGTDFVVSDSRVRKQGGLHLIITYIPESESEDKQVQGRTARQGDPGSVDYIILEDKVPEQFQKPTKFQQYIFNYRQKKEIAQMKQRQQQVEASQKRHDQTINCIKDWSKNEKEFLKSVFNLNQHPQFKEEDYKKKRTVIGIDGTGSMGKILETLLDQLKVIIERIGQMKQKANLKNKNQIEIVIYRNYNSGGQILECSGFHSTDEPLIKFLQNIEAKGGLGRQAIQVFYQYVNSLSDIDAIIIVGDAPPNNPEQIKSSRKLKQWMNFKNNSKFQVTQNRKQQRKIIHNNIPIHSLYSLSHDKLKTECKKYFQNISKETKGESKEFKVQEANASQELTAFFSKKILASIGGVERQKELEDLYQKEYQKRFRQNN